MVTIGGDGRNFGAKKCSPLLMMVTTFVLVAWAKALPVRRSIRVG